MDKNAMASNSSDETSYCSMFDDNCDNEINKWFETFFYHVDQAVFFDNKLSENYDKIEKECKVWNNLFKLKKVDLKNEELKRTIFTAEKLRKNKSQLIDEEIVLDNGKHQLNKNKEKSIQEDEESKQYTKPKQLEYKQLEMKKFNINKMMNQYYDLNDEFDKITLINQLKQDYIRKHVLNSSIKSIEKTTELQSNSLNYNNSNALLPISTNRLKQLSIKQDQIKSNDETATGYTYSYANKKKENKNKKSTKEDQQQQQQQQKARIKSTKSIFRIDHGDRSNLILNSEKIIQPKTPIILPPIQVGRTIYELPQKFDKIEIRDQKEAILNCDKSLNECQLNLLRKTHQFKASTFDRSMIVSMTDNYLHKT